jgi:hypothetical protein
MKNYVSIGARFSGEYRYKLTGPDGKIKDSCDWKPNLLLDMGLNKLRTQSITTSLFIGTSNAAVDVSQINLQGSFLAVHNYIPTTWTPGDSVAPNWEKIRTKTATFAPGVGTGTINEFIMGHTTAQSLSEACIRVVLDAPIVKGALDQLAIEHKFTYWPETGDVVDTVDISGETYDVTMRHYNGYNNGNGNDSLQFGFVFPTQWYLYTGGSLPADMSVGSIPGSNKGGVLLDSTVTYGDDTPPAYWTNFEAVWGIDGPSALDINVINMPMTADVPPVAILMEKVSDGSGIDKPNTHQLTLNWRIYPMRYVP